MAKMEVSFYVNTSPTIKVNKNLGEAAVKTISVDIPDSVDVVNPVLIIDDSHNEGILPSEVNYMVCGAPLSRKYFITAMDYTNAKRVIVAGHVDVLSTYGSLLETTTLNYVRGAGDPTEMDDASYPISDYLIQQYFPMTTWDDIFDAGGDGRQYLLRTVSGNAEDPVYVDLSAGNVFWDGTYYTRDSDQATIYNCFQFTPLGQKTFAPSYVPRQDIQGLSQVLDGYYVRTDIGGTAYVYKWNSKENTMTRM